jgi:hypothetical protein
MPPDDETVVGPAPADPDDDLFDESWQAPKRTNRLTAVLVVALPKTAIVTTPGLGGLAFGNPGSVTGTKAVDGSVTATSVTARRTSG